MNELLSVAILVAFFVLAIGLVQVLSRMIDPPRPRTVSEEIGRSDATARYESLLALRADRSRTPLTP